VDDLALLELEFVEQFLAFPVGSVELVSDDLIEELAKEVKIELNEDEIFTAFFRSKPIVRDKEDLFPRTEFGIPIPILDSVVSLPIPLLEEAELDRGILKGDEVVFVFNSTEEERVDVKVSIEELTKDGLPLVLNYVIEPSGSGTTFFTSEPIDLDGYSVDFSGGSMTMRYDARLPGGQRIIFPLSFVQISALDFSYLEGTISRSSFASESDRIDIDIQDSLIAGSYQFQNPKIHFDVQNSFGIPIGIRVKTVTMVSEDLRRTPLVSSLFDQVILLEYPDFDQKGTTIHDQFTFDKSNSNIVDVATDDVIAVEYELDVVIHPDESSTTDFFVLDSSAAIVSALFELSFDAKVEDVRVKRSIGVDLQTLDSLSYLRLKMVVDNGIPLSFSPVFTLRDTVTNDSLLLQSDPRAEILTAVTDEFGDVLTVSTSTLYYELPENQLLDILKMNQLEADITLQSPTDGNSATRMRPCQTLDIRIGAEAKIRQ